MRLRAVLVSATMADLTEESAKRHGGRAVGFGCAWGSAAEKMKRPRVQLLPQTEGQGQGTCLWGDILPRDRGPSLMRMPPAPRPASRSSTPRARHTAHHVAKPSQKAKIASNQLLPRKP